MFQDIAKYTERAGLDTSDLKKALQVMNVVPKAANDMMQVGRLQGFNVSRPLSNNSGHDRLWSIPCFIFHIDLSLLRATKTSF